MEAGDKKEIVSVEDFCRLGERLVEQKLYEEAISLYQTAGKIFPGSLAIKLNQARVEELHRSKILEKQKNQEEGDLNLRRRDDLLAVELRKFPVLKGLADEELVQLAKITSERRVNSEEVVFREDDLTEGLYLIHSGSVRMVKATPFGEQPLLSLGADAFFGEMDFIDSLHCSTDAIANSPSILFSISKGELEEIFVSHKHIAVQFYWHFWKAMSGRIRASNELLKSFFIEARDEDRKRVLEGSTGEAVTVDLQNKLAILKEKGLSSKELRLLATFSKEEFFKEGQNIFLEGDRGDKLYIILDGKIRISKYIPGAGEEALAILEKGDFFGEMALVDHAPRSADAKAHTDVTVLPIESRLLNDILAKDVLTSYQFLQIVCKILSRRLREINMKIYQWRVMSGGF